MIIQEIGRKDCEHEIKAEDIELWCESTSKREPSLRLTCTKCGRRIECTKAEWRYYEAFGKWPSVSWPKAVKKSDW